MQTIKQVVLFSSFIGAWALCIPLDALSQRGPTHATTPSTQRPIPPQQNSTWSSLGGALDQGAQIRQQQREAQLFWDQQRQQAIQQQDWNRRWLEQQNQLRREQEARQRLQNDLDRHRQQFGNAHSTPFIAPPQAPISVEQQRRLTEQSNRIAAEREQSFRNRGLAPPPRPAYPPAYQPRLCADGRGRSWNC